MYRFRFGLPALLSALIMACFLSTHAYAGQQPQPVDKPVLLASIKPLQLIALAVAGEHADVELLLPVSVSPHLYQLKPSDRQRLAEADLLIWMGPQLERFLQKPVSLLKQQQVLTLLSAETNIHDHQHDGHHGEDPHRWLNPLEAIEIAQIIKQHLLVLAPQYAELYTKNFQVFQNKLKKLDTVIAEQINQKNIKPYIVLHDGYSHFENQYGVKRLAAVSISPDRKPGAKHIWTLEKNIKSGDVHCVFSEPQYNPAVLKSLLSDSDIKQALLDPLATDIKLSPQAYEQFMTAFSQSFLKCVR